MTIAIANVTNTHTFAYWRDRTNELAHAMTTKVVTAESNAVNGNVSVNGTFHATTLIANSSIRGGNVSTSNTLNVSSNLNITGTQFSVGANVFANSSVYHVGNTTVNNYFNSSEIKIRNSSGNLTINSSSISLDGVPVLPAIVDTNVSGNSASIIDSFNMSVYRGGEYIISIKNNEANGYQISKLLVLSDDGAGPQVTDYSVLYSNNQLVIFSANANSTHVRLLSTTQLANAASNVQIKASRTLIVV